MLYRNMNKNVCKLRKSNRAVKSQSTGYSFELGGGRNGHFRTFDCGFQVAMDIAPKLNIIEKENNNKKKTRNNRVYTSRAIFVSKQMKLLFTQPKLKSGLFQMATRQPSRGMSRRLLLMQQSICSLRRVAANIVKQLPMQVRFRSNFLKCCPPGVVVVSPYAVSTHTHTKNQANRKKTQEVNRA